ncbi:hypothetical protein [Hyphomonas sp.]|uniref:hypothetical protein n=1 Tax=Hyphomonas sp. TaxID=87 RepID=UPI0025C4033D|nr:hypothetical protein [Hyphomonas sp.]
MRFLVAAAAILLANLCGLAALQAEAQGLPKYLKSCKKEKSGITVEDTLVVPSPGGPPGIVKIVRQTYDCRNPETRNNQWIALYGMTDANGKVLVPLDYAQVLPFSTKGAVVIDHGDEAYPKNLKHRTYMAGKGEGKDKFDFKWVSVMRADRACDKPPVNAADRPVSAVVGEFFFGLGAKGEGKHHLVLFLPDGKTRKLEFMGGAGVVISAHRMGDVLLTRWKDPEGIVRAGILDLEGRPVAPVLGTPAIWSTLAARQADGVELQGCHAELSQDLFIEGPSLDWDPAQKFFGPLLIPVRRDGQPATLPDGAIGMFPAYHREYSPARHTFRENTVMWGVVFPAGNGFEFTLHLGTPSEALIAAATAPRYSDIGRSIDHGGMVGAKSVADGLWRWFRADTDIPVGAANADFQLSLNSAWEVQNGEAAARNQILAAEWAKQEAARAEYHKRLWAQAREQGRLCDYRVDSTSPAPEVEEFLIACGPSRQPGLADLARTKGVPEATISNAVQEEWQRQMAQSKMLAEAEEAARIRRLNNANKDPGAGYYPGKWETAIRLGGNATVDAINESSDNWLEQRRDQYIADWQRSQRAY